MFVKPPYAEEMYIEPQKDLGFWGNVHQGTQNVCTRFCPFTTIKRDCTHLESKILGFVIAALLVAGVALWAMGQQMGRPQFTLLGKVFSFIAVGSLSLWGLFFFCRCCGCIETRNY
jgi:hypothetical protein